MRHRGPTTRLTRAQVVEIGKLLEVNGCKVDGYYKFHSGWDDHDIATVVGVSVKNVQGVRLDIYGQLWSQAKLDRMAQSPTQPELPFGDPEVDQLRAQLASTRQAMQQQWATIKVLHDTMAGLLNKLGEPPMTLKIPVDVSILLDTWED